jgi:hypothetical protein
MKIKRGQVAERYKREIGNMYQLDN